MKKTILILVVLALLAPSAAMAATEFSLGGFIKLSSFWGSTQDGFANGAVIQRNNDQQFQHGRFHMSAQESRFNFTIKGPKLWGATTTGFIEMDFDAADARVSATSSYAPRLRHAMFRLNWPETELLFGQYWGFFSEYSPEGTLDSQLTNHGFVNQRVPQIRLTQKFASNWTIAGMVAKPYDPTTAATAPSAPDANFAGTTVQPGQIQAGTAGVEGQSAEMPQLQGKLAYEKDLWGKAAFYGRPRGFTAQVAAGWQRTRYKSGTNAGLFTFGQNQFGITSVSQNGQQYLDPWIVQGTLFIPVLPTYSANLAGTASLTAQWFIGQGVSAFGGGRDEDNSWFNFSGIANVNGANVFAYDRRLMNQFGGYIQGQYWFTNQWFINVDWGMIRDFNVNRSTSGILAGQPNTSNPFGNMYASQNDQVKVWNQIDATLWYRPIEAIKFGLQYTYERTDFLQKLNNPSLTPGANAAAAGQVQGQPSSGAKDFGESHRIQFVAIMFF